jgi:hypothetical protein
MGLTPSADRVSIAVHYLDLRGNTGLSWQVKTNSVA